MKTRWKRLLSLTLAMTVAMTSFSPMSLVKADAADLQVQAKALSEYEIYPNPHTTNYTGGNFALKNQVQLVYETGIDQYTKDKMNTVIELKEGMKSTVGTAVDGTKTNILVGIKGSNGYVDQYFATNNLVTDATIFTKTDAYVLSIKDGVIAILGKDADAAFYGVTTLKHIFRQLEGLDILNLHINDYSDVAFRGFIEGYYGNPWSNEDRADLMTYGGEIKANTYIFAPKDDPYHNSKWRVLYPEEELKEIEKLAEAGNKSKCRYVWSIHPFMSSAFNFSSEASYNNDFGVITAKFTQLLEHGVRQFGVLADDAGAASTDNMIRLLTDLTEWLKEQQATYPDLKIDLPFCPAAYAGAYPDKKFAQLPETVNIIQTGGKIWGEVSEQFSTTFMTNMGRAPYYWVNWPCTDNSKQHLIMGGHNTFLHANVPPEKIQGIVLNPMQQSEPSKAAIFLGADYAWNVWENPEQGDQAWNDMFDYMDHMNANETDASNALKELCKHMINQNMDGRVAVLQESVELAPKLNKFKEDFGASKQVKTQAAELIEEFKIINNAAKLYKENANNKRLSGQMIHWLNAANNITDANMEFLKAVVALEEGKNDQVWSHYSNGMALYEQSKTYTFPYVGSIQTAEFGVQHIVPFAKFLMQKLSGSVLGIVDPTKVIKSAITSRTDNPEGDINNLLDNNESTACVWKNPNTLSVGTYVGVMYNRPITVNDITVVLGAPSNANDRFTASKLQYTVDGATWIDIEGAVYGNVARIEKDGLNLQAKGVRIVATAEKTNTWIGFKDFTVNKADYVVDETPSEENLTLSGTLQRTNIWEVHQGTEGNLTDGNDNTMVWYNVKNTDTTQVGDFLGFDYGKEEEIGKIHIVVGADNGDKWTGYKLDYSTNGTDWTTYKTYAGKASGKDIIDENLTGSGIRARYVRLVNTVQLNKWIKFSEFKVEKVSSTGLVKYTYTNKEDLKNIKNVVSDASFALTAKSGITLAKGEYVGLKLDRIRDLANLNVVAANGSNLTLQISNNEVEWVNVTNPQEVGTARYIRLMNATNSAITFDLSSFVVNTNEIKGITYMDSNIGINDAAGDARNNGGAEKWFDGNLFSWGKFTGAQVKDQFVKYDLGQPRDIKKITMSVLDTEADYLRDGKIQVSLDGNTWTDVVTVGDGVADAQASDDILNCKGWEHGKVNVAMAEATGILDTPVKARYLRILITANYPHRWLKVNEIEINDGEYVKTSNDPTFESTVVEQRNFGPEKLMDGDLSTAYKPNMEGETQGTLIYRLSEKTQVKQINMLQNGNAISNAKVSIRVGKDQWVELGTMNKSLNSFYNTSYDHVYEIKLEWSGVTPIIYEMITLGAEHATLPDTSAARSALQSAYDTAKAMEKGNYTDATWNVLQKAIADAKAVLDDENADVSALTNAKNDIDAAVAGLKENVVAKKYKVDVKVDGTDVVKVVGAGTYEEGSTATLELLIPKDQVKLEFLGWFEGTTKVHGDNRYTFTVTKDITLTAKFRQTSIPQLSGWIKENNKWVFYKDGNKVKNQWLKDKGNWYFLAKDGYMKTGWFKEGATWYYLDTNGKMLTGWQKISGTWYLLAGNGKMLTGWQKVSGKWYLLASSGKMLTGWQKVSGKWYLLASSGKMLTGWQKVGNTWYYLNGSGAMVTNWLKLNNKWYFLKSSGAMVTGWYKVGAKTYYFNGSGVWTGATK